MLASFVSLLLLVLFARLWCWCCLLALLLLCCFEAEWIVVCFVWHDFVFGLVTWFLFVLLFICGFVFVVLVDLVVGGLCFGVAVWGWLGWIVLGGDCLAC